MTLLKNLTRKYKIVRNEIPGVLGDVYVCCDKHLAVYLNSRKGRKGARAYGWEMMQMGDWEATYKLPFKDFDKAAVLIDAKKAKTRPRKV